MSKQPGYFRERPKGSGHYQLIVTIGTNFEKKPLKYYRSVDCKSDAQARKELAKFYTECEAGNVEKPATLTVAKLVEKYMNECIKPNAKPTTVRGYTTIVKRIDIIGNNKANKLSRPQVQAWINSLAETLSPKSIKNTLSFLHAAYEWSIDMDILKSNPCDHVRKPKLQKKEAQSYSEAEVKTLLDAMGVMPEEDVNYKAAIMLALLCGLRRGEICGLNWEDVDLLKSRLKIVRTRNLDVKVGIYIDTPKTEKSVRQLTMPKELTDVLKDLKEYQEVAASYYAVDSDAVIRSSTGAPIWPNSLGSWISDYEEKIGLPRIGMHGLRHTNASMMVNANLDVAKVSRRLGHSNISTTLNIYTHLFEADDKQIADDISSEIKNLN